MTAIADAPSLWDRTAPASPPRSPLSEETATDVAIVGGGFTGLSAALHLAEAGVACTLLEAERIGHGGSGRNAGLVNAGLWLPPAEVARRLGSEAGGRLLTALSAAPDVVFSLIEKHQIRAEATREGTIHAAHSSAGRRDLEARAKGWLDLGAPVELLDRERTRAMTGSGRFHGGLLDRRAGTINPMGYARGLADAASRAGAVLHEHSRAVKLQRRGDGWRIETEAGSVRASHVALATNGYSDKLWPGLDRALTPIHYFQIASRPLGERANAILPGRQGLWDTGRVMRSVRVDHEGRLIVGSMGRLLGPDAAISRRWAAKAARHLFPDLGPIEWAEAWHGRIGMTRDHLPRLLEPASGLLVPIGYNGRGIGPGTVFGHAIAARIARKEVLPLAISTLRPEPAPRLMAALYEAGFRTYRLAASL